MKATISEDGKVLVLCDEDPSMPLNRCFVIKAIPEMWDRVAELEDKLRDMQCKFNSRSPSKMLQDVLAKLERRSENCERFDNSIGAAAYNDCIQLIRSQLPKDNS